MKPDDPRFFHDLRSPLARAKSYTKLLEEALPGEKAELLILLCQALDDLDRLLSEAERTLLV